MAYVSGLAQRIREALAGLPGITERKMFGGLALLVDGKMFVGAQDSALMARVGPERHHDALTVPHVREIDFTGRPRTRRQVSHFPSCLVALAAFAGTAINRQLRDTDDVPRRFVYHLTLPPGRLATCGGRLTAGRTRWMRGTAT
jgi:hypothetical protein